MAAAPPPLISFLLCFYLLGDTPPPPQHPSWVFSVVSQTPSPIILFHNLFFQLCFPSSNFYSCSLTYIVDYLLEICSWRTKPVRGEEGVDKSRKRSHLLLENSKQKQDLPQELRAAFCQVTTPQHCSFRSSLEVRGDPPSPQSPFRPAEHSAGTLLPRPPSLQDVRRVQGMHPRMHGVVLPRCLC